jgi:aminopeptidase N
VQKNLVALMSACRVGSFNVDQDLVEYKFEQKIPIPSYLIAIVAADLVSK